MNYKFLLDIFWPKKCLKCGAYGEFVCADCFDEIELFATSTCFGCGRISDDGKVCPNCRKRLNISFDAIFVGTHYLGLPLQMIESLKYLGYRDLAEIIGEMMIRRILLSAFDYKKFVVTAAPLHISRKNERGFNQSELIARYIAKRLGLEYQDLLIKKIKTERQVGLTREKRLENVREVFEARKGVIGKNIIIIDDVVTTGATLSECAKVLKAAGAKKVVGIVAARNI
ncbi:MAG: ComF family protein [Candidatus Berkelbacteria bacterium]